MRMKKALLAAAALVALPVAAQAQSLQYPGFYLGAEGGASWMLNSTINLNGFGGVANIYPNTGFAVGGVVGYDFVGPRVEVEGVYRGNTATVNFSPIGAPNTSFNASINQVAVMANLYYDFNAGGTIVPYVGAGAGVAFVTDYAFGTSQSSTQFAYQGIIGVGYNVTDQFRVNLDGRYYGTTNPTIANGNASFSNNNFSIMAGLQFKFGAPVPVAAPPPPMVQQAPSCMV